MCTSSTWGLCFNSQKVLKSSDLPEGTYIYRDYGASRRWWNVFFFWFSRHWIWPARLYLWTSYQRSIFNRTFSQSFHVQFLWSVDFASCYHWQGWHPAWSSPTVANLLHVWTCCASSVVLRYTSIVKCSYLSCSSFLSAWNSLSILLSPSEGIFEHRITTHWKVFFL